MTKDAARNGDATTPAAPSSPAEVDPASDLSALVDEMEERVTLQRQEEGHAGTAAERAAITPAEPDQHAPD